MRALEEINATADLMTTYLANVTLHTFEHEHAYGLLTRHYREYVMALQILQMGFLPSFFVSEEILIPLLNAIEIELAEKHSDYRLLSKEPLFYYQLVDFLYGRFDDKLVITLKIPLTIFQNYFQVFSVKTLLLRLPK